jgi:4-amino-4-deoxy-L-arabinose transferase-like glycosyltransferase
VYAYGGFFYEICLLARSLLRALWSPVGEVGLVIAYRSVSALFGTATVAMLYLLLRRVVAGSTAPLLGATLLAIMPLHVWDSHFAVTDVTLTFWMTATVAAAVWAYERPTWARFVVASVLAGIATGTKFNGAFEAVAIALAALLGLGERRLRMGQLVIWGLSGVVAALAALLLASPFALVKASTVWKALQREMAHVQSLDYGFNLWAPGWQYKPYVYQFGAAFPFSFGIPLYASVLGGLVFCALRRRRVLIVPFGYAGFYLAVVGSWDFVPLRYYLPVEPVLLMAAALAFAAGLSAPTARLRRWTGAGLGLVLAYTVAFTVSTTTRFTDDTRLQAERWLQPRLANGASAITVGADWYLPTPKGEVLHLLQYKAMPGEVARRRPTYVVLTSLHYARSYRQQDENVAMWDTVRRGGLPYRLARRFRAEYLNWRFYTRLDPMYEGYFVSPTIEVYQRVDRGETVARARAGGPADSTGP